MHTAERHLTDSFFRGTLPPERFDSLFGHLRVCDPCRSYFDTQRGLFRQLSGSSQPLARSEADLIKRQLLTQLSRHERSRRWFGLPRWLFAIQALALPALALMFILPERQARIDDGFSAKSAGVAPAPELVEVLCLTPQQTGMRVLPISEQSPRCTVGSYLMIATSGGQLPTNLLAMVMDGEGDVLFRANQENPQPKQLFVSHLKLEEPGTLQVVALGGDKELNEVEVQDAARRVAAHSPPGVEVHRVITVEVGL